MTAYAARLPAGRLHVASPTGRGYRTACGRELHGADLVVYVGRRTCARVWRLDLTCRDCERLIAQHGRGRR